jgi:hypothetical protein
MGDCGEPGWGGTTVTWTKPRIVGALLVVTVAVGVAVSGRTPAAPAPPAGVRAWEYKVVQDFQLVNLGRPAAAQGGAERDLRADGMNALGAEGWELVATTAGGQGVSATYFFKRPK